MSWFEKFDISIDVVMGKEIKTLKGVSYDDRELHNLTTIGKMFSELYNRIKTLETEVETLSAEQKALKYTGIYDYIKQNNMKHYIFRGNDSEQERVIRKLLYKTFSECIEALHIDGSKYIYILKNGKYYCFNTPICLSELIEKLEEYNKELQDEKDRDNRE